MLRLAMRTRSRSLLRSPRMPGDCHPCAGSDLLPVCPLRTRRIRLTRFRTGSAASRGFFENQGAARVGLAFPASRRRDSESSLRGARGAPAAHARRRRRLVIETMLPPRLTLAAETRHELLLAVACLERSPPA